jgi:hypothetical protein
VDIVIEAKDRMVRLGDWKLSYEPLADGPLYKLFNIREDAACSQDVLARNSGIAAELRALLEAWMAADAAGVPAVPGAESGNDIDPYPPVAKGASK